MRTLRAWPTALIDCREGSRWSPGPGTASGGRPRRRSPARRVGGGERPRHRRVRRRHQFGGCRPTVDAIRARVAPPPTTTPSPTPHGCQAAVQTAVDALRAARHRRRLRGGHHRRHAGGRRRDLPALHVVVPAPEVLARTRRVAGDGRAAGGRLITTTSHGATGLLGQPIFAAAMGGVISMTPAIASSTRPPGSPRTACRRVVRPGCMR